MPRAIDVEVRLKIITMFKDGYSNSEIPSESNIGINTVKRWKSRFVNEDSLDTHYTNCRSSSVLTDG